MTQRQEKAAELQSKAEQWRSLASRQQEVAMQMQQAANIQHELAQLWDKLGDSEAAGEARNMEEFLHTLTKRALHLEEHALEKIEQVVLEAGSVLQSQ